MGTRRCTITAFNMRKKESPNRSDWRSGAFVNDRLRVLFVNDIYTLVRFRPANVEDRNEAKDSKLLRVRLENHFEWVGSDGSMAQPEPLARRSDPCLSSTNSQPRLAASTTTTIRVILAQLSSPFNLISLRKRKNTPLGPIATHLHPIASLTRT